MTPEIFNTLIQNRLDKCEELLTNKGIAYAGHKDRLDNFKRNAENLGMTPYQIWAVYTFKHLDAIRNAIRDNPTAPVDKSEGLLGRITDVINYMLLLEALLAETKTQNDSSTNSTKSTNSGEQAGTNKHPAAGLCGAERC